ncbi:amidase [Sphingomonas hengshuiensis]|uniref:Amidase n=1 Tax=Sphingomonas hengshuiensis TaxID=1609977 RepID=A0A7U5BEW4_9SPHN|nr:amidase [Sphingomonas hengshuiensis]AJP74002.1 amidase [Sphingomonas hengshuiensis]
MRFWLAAAILASAAVPAAAQDIVTRELPGRGFAVEEKSIDALQAMLAAGTATSAGLVDAYIERIRTIDRAGPTLRSVIAVTPDALAQAAASDKRRKAGTLLGPLDGVPVLIKDNIETRELPTTAGSLALAANDTKRDAPVVALLRAQGAVILGKTNLSEWANIRSNNSMSGWSAVGGLVKNPYALDRSACGSSSGSGAAVAASLAAVAVGTETDGSVVCPASMNGLVGLKPTLGLVSRTHVVPISHSQDTPGPMGRSVKDVALLFAAMIGSDPADAATKGADGYRRDYAAGLRGDALKGMRVGYWRPEMEAPLGAAFDKALDVLRGAGAILVEVKMPELKGLGEAESVVLYTELKADLAAYLATTPAAVTVRTLADVIAFNDAHADAEMPFFGQETFLKSEKLKGLDDPEYLGARAKSLRLAGVEGIDAMLKTGDVRLLVTPTYGTPWLSDPAHGDQFTGPSASELPAVSGYPHLTVPMGLVEGLPAGLSFIGTAYSDGLLLGAGYAYEQASHARVVPRYLPSAPADLGPRAIR